MGTNSKSKLPNACNGDRISSLPNEILCRILSLLPTKEAVKTSVLSPRWRFVWAPIPTLDLCDKSSQRALNSVGPSFAEFVGRRLFTHRFHRDRGFAEFVDRALVIRGSSDIHTFRLSCTGVENYPSVEAWICTAIRLKVVELELVLHSLSYPFELPDNLLTCKTLVVLKLWLESNVTFTPTSGCFPNLKFFHARIRNPDADSMETLFYSCPALEDLIIDGLVAVRKVLNFNISAPKLKRLKIYLVKDEPWEETGSNISFEVNAPNLETFDLEEDFFANYYLNANLPSKVNINLEYVHKSGHDDYELGWDYRLQKLFAGIINVKFLSLSAPIFGDPGCYTEDNFPFPKLNRLNHLELLLDTCCNWKALIDLLNMSPHLEYLDFTTNKKCKADHPLEDSVREWVSPEFVPVCLSSYLKTISIQGIEGRHDEMEVTKYLLKHGEVLDKVTFYTSAVRADHKMKLCQDISMFSKGSMTCQIDFLEK
ncbi:F-box/FBD/LRR-repeat protein At5g56420 [Pyrus x bretschneideri]|uniref:F-box/FBD/LRR-repeat protein At5g56420 n=1 Tax=Pyrus x bretschneideri TaxID=225117 RepID=UPI0005114D59|nr:F-box/FBD/LRR-repeat protein At5g56420 [Pyrus x bretschneideri]XP_048442915.1 F-box/FBD/LRR-repeat protein At5g56420 [Pyrus x bretschneideri]